jgi:SSS family solute:Na+ symporter
MWLPNGPPCANHFLGRGHFLHGFDPLAPGQLRIGIGASTGAVLIMHWYWRRINAWSEIPAMSCAFLGLDGGAFSFPLVFAKSTLIPVGVTYRCLAGARTYPFTRSRLDLVDLVWNFLDWVYGCVMIYSSLFGIGKIVLKEAGVGLGGIIHWDLSRRGWSTVLE